MEGISAAGIQLRRRRACRRRGDMGGRARWMSTTGTEPDLQGEGDTEVKIWGSGSGPCSQSCGPRKPGEQRGQLLRLWQHQSLEGAPGSEQTHHLPSPPAPQCPAQEADVGSWRARGSCVPCWCALEALGYIPDNPPHSLVLQAHDFHPTQGPYGMLGLRP